MARKRHLKLSILNQSCHPKRYQTFLMKTGCPPYLANLKGESLSDAHYLRLILCRYFITSSYDGQIRMFDYSKNLVSSTVAHSAPISSICMISEADSSYTIASSSQDLTAQITQVTLDSSSPSSTVLASLHLHTSSLSSVASNSSGTHLLTSSWDGLIGLWDTTIPSSDEVSEPIPNERDRKKRRRIDNGSKPRRKAPLLVLKSHTSRVSKALFAAEDQKKAYSCGFDSTVRKWDAEHGVCIHTFVSGFRANDSDTLY